MKPTVDPPAAQSDDICPERGIPQSECPWYCSHETPDRIHILRHKVAEAQWNALEMARKADAAERRAEEAEYHVEQLRDALERAERQVERAERLIDSWQSDAPDHSNPIFIKRLREALRYEPDSGACGEHHWLDRPESDTRECLICGTEEVG